RKDKEDAQALKSAEKEAGDAKKKADEKLNHFNSLANARNKHVEVEEKTIMTKSQRINAAKDEY
ncbi:MAG: hypothetical protein KAV87_02225, partial [Desulfobacteraceae bacterium]|nr:hypothetical protein [Desulfobacteraceae bacterium]